MTVATSIGFFLFKQIMADGKKSFMFYCDWQGTFEALPDDKAGELIKHVLRYVNDEDPQSNDILINAVFANIKATLKRDLKKWEQKSNRNRESANMRWQQKNANACERIKLDAKNADRDKVKDTDTVIDKVIDKVRDKDILLKKESGRFIAPSLQEVKDLAIERKYLNFDFETFINFYESKGWMVGKSKMKDWKASAALWNSRNKNQNNAINQNNNSVGTHRIGSNFDEPM
jgi:hypothetical protein